MSKRHSTTSNPSTIKSARMPDLTQERIHKNGSAMTNKSRRVTRSALRSSQRAADLNESNMETDSTPINTPPARDDPKRSDTTSHRWEPYYDDKWKSSVIENEFLLNTFVEKLPVIMKSVELGDKFWSLLLQRGVVNEETKSRIQGHKLRQVQAASLVHHVMSVEVYKFHGFIWALVNSNQCHLAELLGFAVRDYLDVDVFLMSSAFQCPACCEIYTKAYILTGCGHYVCAPCVKGAQFICKDNKKEDVTCPVPECGKITEASPCAGKIGLEEDGDFSDLCEAMLKEVTKVSAVTNEGQSTAENEEEEENSNTGSEEKEGMSTDSKEKQQDNNRPQRLQEGISYLEMKISCLQKYKHLLGKCEPELKDYIVRTVEIAKQNVDQWTKETLRWYSSVWQQVEKNLQKSVKWKYAASQLSVLMTARPGFLEGCLKRKIPLPKETVTDAGEKIITQLDAGCPIPLLFPYKFCIPPEDECRAEMTFSYTVENVSKLKGTQLSPPCMVRNLPWKIMVQPYDQHADQHNQKSISVYLYANAESGSSSWLCYVTAELRLLSWKKDGQPYTIRLQDVFTSERRRCGYRPFISWNNLMEPEYGYVKDDSIRLEVHIIAGPLTWQKIYTLPGQQRIQRFVNTTLNQGIQPTNSFATTHQSLHTNPNAGAREGQPTLMSRTF